MARIPNERPITRSFHCPKCDKNDTPKLGDIFAVLGAKGKFHIKQYSGGGERGITPHIIQKEQDNGDVEIRVCCCVCGIEIYHDETFNDIEIDIFETRRMKLPRNEWEALKSFKDEQFFI